MTAPRPRRASARWLDGDCPAEVLAIFDNGGKTWDRYTVLYVPAPGSYYVPYLAASSEPFAPWGFGQHGEMTVWDARAYRYRAARRESCRWSDLPADVQRAVRQYLQAIESEKN